MLFYEMPLVRNADKPGRVLTHLDFDTVEEAFVKAAQHAACRIVPRVRHAYTVEISPGQTAGGHSHERKWELVRCLAGRVDLLLVDSKDPARREILDLSAGQMPSESRAIVLIPGIAHALVNRSFPRGPAVIEILSTAPPRDADDHPFDLIPCFPQE